MQDNMGRATLLVPASSQQSRERGLPSHASGSCGVFFFRSGSLFNRCVRLEPKPLSVQLLILLIMFFLCPSSSPFSWCCRERSHGDELIAVTPNSLSCALLAYV